jgi:hypothetical protein
MLCSSESADPAGEKSLIACRSALSKRSDRVARYDDHTLPCVAVTRVQSTAEKPFLRLNNNYVRGMSLDAFKYVSVTL